MATIRLIPSVLYNAASSYLSISNEQNAFSNTDDTTYATVKNTYSSTSSRYVYLRGFNFDDIPEGAIINSFTVKLKAYESGISTSDSYTPHLANGTRAINGSCTAITTSASVHTFTGVTADWEKIKGYGSNFGIRINCRRASRNTTGYMYIYGAEIEVVIGGSGDESQFYIKETATQWDKYSKLWKKGTNGWIEVDPYEELDTSKQYRVVDVS